MKTLITLAILLLALPLAAADENGKKVELEGKLRTGIVAIGGETTGTIIEVKKEFYELDFGKDKDLRQKAKKLNGKNVKVTGTLVIKKGVEVKVRRIVTVMKLEEVE